MMRIRKVGLVLATLVLFVFVAAPDARADSFTFTGTLTPGSPVQLFGFTVTNSSSVLVRGTANFDLALSLFDAAGDTLNIAIDEDGIGPPFVAILEDGFGDLFLTPGNYVIGVTPLPLLPGANLNEGFFFATDQFGQPLTFADFNFNGGSFTLEISGVGVNQAGEIPEPATMLLLGTGLAGVAAGLRRRRREHNSRMRAK
jgi:PEP-CTERM motif